MKFKKFFIKLTYIISISTLTSCSMLRFTSHNTQKNLDVFKYKNDRNNEYATEIVQSTIQKLKKNNVVYFPLDQYDILNQFFNILDEHAVFLRTHPNFTIKIEGHADERGTPEYNIALGERRANSIKLYLQSNGVLSQQIFIVSYGKEKPVSLGHNEESYSKNRRAVLIYQ